MTGEDPAEDHAGAFAAETISGQFYRRWHGRDPIKTIEHREQRQAIEREISERQIEQRQSTLQDYPEGGAFAGEGRHGAMIPKPGLVRSSNDMRG